MTMEKYSQDDDSLVDGLRNEEAQLMQKMQSFMMIAEKTASEEGDMRSTENRLQAVRSKITSIDMERAKKARGDG